VFELMKKQEDTRQSEENALKSKYQAMQAQHETVFRFLYSNWFDCISLIAATYL